MPERVRKNALLPPPNDDNMVEMDYVSSIFDDIKDGIKRYWSPWSPGGLNVDLPIIIQRVCDMRCAEASLHGYHEWTYDSLKMEQFIRLLIKDFLIDTFHMPDITLVEFNDCEDMTEDTMIAFIDAVREIWESELSRTGYLG